MKMRRRAGVIFIYDFAKSEMEEEELELFLTHHHHTVLS